MREEWERQENELRERQENELREQQEREEQELEEMIRVEQVRLEEEKRWAEEEERRLDEAHREWLRRLEEARQAPEEEEEEAEVEPSAPKKRKVGEVVSEHNKIFIRLMEFLIEDGTFLPPMRAGRQGLLQENARTRLLKVRGTENKMQRGRRATEKERNGGRERKNGEGEKTKKGRGFGKWRRREIRGIEEDRGSAGRDNGESTRVDRGGRRSNGRATGHKVGDGSVDEETRGKGTETGKGER